MDAEPVYDGSVYKPLARLQKESHVKSLDEYKKLYKKSIENPEEFWKNVASSFYFKSPPTGKFWEYNFNVHNGPISIKWMEGATTNICYNAVDRHVENGNADKTAFYW